MKPPTKGISVSIITETPQNNTFAQSQTVACKIGAVAPDAVFCTFALQGNKKIPYKRSGQGVARDTDPTDLYNAEDTLITLMITQAREAIEVATGLSLIPKDITTYFNNISGNFDIPFGPIDIDTFELFDMEQNGIEVTTPNLQLIGNEFPKLVFPRYANLKATYEAGYTTIPKDLKLAILDQISYDYLPDLIKESLISSSMVKLPATNAITNGESTPG